MPDHLERYYLINGKGYWEDNLERLEQQALYRLSDGGSYTQKELIEMTSHSETYFNLDGTRYNKNSIDYMLSTMGPGPNSTYGSGQTIYTRKRLEGVMALFQSATHPPGATLQGRDTSTREPRNDDDSRSEITQTTLSTGGMDTPRALEGEDEDDDDELVAKIIANMQTRMKAVKGHKKLVAEVEKLRKLLAEKEEALVESEKVMALEVGLVSSRSEGHS